MSDRREEILNQEHRKFVEKEGTSSIHTKDFPGAYKLQALAAMDEYMKEVCLELLQYLAVDDVRVSWYMGDDGKKVYTFNYKGDLLTKEQLFENFL